MSHQATVVLGTRPELIKLAPIINRLGPNVRVIHTGQHDHVQMSARIAATFGIHLQHLTTRRDPARGRGAQLGDMVAALDQLLRADPPAVVVVQGDTTSALAGALAANHADLPLVHVEAGLRSFDRTMPEEHNRVLIDHLADLCCAPTQLNRTNLRAEAIPDHRILLTGNTIVEAIQTMLPGPTTRTQLLHKHQLAPRGYVLATLHRPENVDHPEILDLLLTQLATTGAPVILPLHPRTSRRIDEFGLAHSLCPLQTTEPLDYPDFVALAHCAALLISDSGGVVEEASVIKTPIIIVRRSTERPEIEPTFGVRITPSRDLGALARRWLCHSDRRHHDLAGLPSPFGDGTAAHRITAALNQLTRPNPGPGIPRPPITSDHCLADEVGLPPQRTPPRDNVASAGSLDMPAWPLSAGRPAARALPSTSTGSRQVQPKAL